MPTTDNIKTNILFGNFFVYGKVTGHLKILIKKWFSYLSEIYIRFENNEKIKYFGPLNNEHPYACQPVRQVRN